MTDQPTRASGGGNRAIQVAVTRAGTDDLSRLAATSVEAPEAVAVAIADHGLVVKLDPQLTQRIRATGGDQASLMDAGCIGPYPPGSERC